MAARMADKEQLARQWSDAAQKWIDYVRSPRGDPSRRGVLDDWTVDAVGDVRDLDVIDLGCGEGRFARMLAARGARVLGVDLCEPLIAAARAATTSSLQTYAVGDM